MPLFNFRKNFRFFSFNFRQNFDVRTFSRWLSIRGTNLFGELKKPFFFKMFTLVLLDEFLDGFSKFAWKRFYRTLSMRKKFHRSQSIRRTTFLVCSWTSERMLSIRGTNFTACWACAETISSQTELTRKQFHRMLSIRGTNTNCLDRRMGYMEQRLKIGERNGRQGTET
jgi:hypothetical protein